MSKKKRRSDLPPEGLWISPRGKRIEVVEHLIALARYPELFDLSPQQVSLNVDLLRDVAVELITNGWIRFRYLAGVYAFEVDNAKRRIGTIEDVLADVGAFQEETVTISQIEPEREFEATVADVYDRKIFGYQENPGRNRWRLS